MDRKLDNSYNKSQKMSQMMQLKLQSEKEGLPTDLKSKLGS